MFCSSCCISTSQVNSIGAGGRLGGGRKSHAVWTACVVVALICVCAGTRVARHGVAVSGVRPPPSCPLCRNVTVIRVNARRSRSMSKAERQQQLLKSLEDRTTPEDQQQQIQRQRNRTVWQLSPATGRGFGAGVHAGALTGVVSGAVMCLWHWRSRVVASSKDFHSLKPPVSASGKVWIMCLVPRCLLLSPGAGGGRPLRADWNELLSEVPGITTRAALTVTPRLFRVISVRNCCLTQCICKVVLRGRTALK